MLRLKGSHNGQKSGQCCLIEAIRRTDMFVFGATFANKAQEQQEQSMTASLQALQKNGTIPADLNQSTAKNYLLLAFKLNLNDAAVQIAGKYYNRIMAEYHSDPIFQGAWDGYVSNKSEFLKPLIVSQLDVAGYGKFAANLGSGFMQSMGSAAKQASDEEDYSSFWQGTKTIFKNYIVNPGGWLDLALSPLSTASYVGTSLVEGDPSIKWIKPPFRKWVGDLASSAYENYGGSVTIPLPLVHDMKLPFINTWQATKDISGFFWSMLPVKSWVDFSKKYDMALNDPTPENISTAVLYRQMAFIDSMLFFSIAAKPLKAGYMAAQSTLFMKRVELELVAKAMENGYEKSAAESFAKETVQGMEKKGLFQGKTIKDVAKQVAKEDIPIEKRTPIVVDGGGSAYDSSPSTVNISPEIPGLASSSRQLAAQATAKVIGFTSETVPDFFTNTVPAFLSKRKMSLLDFLENTWTKSKTGNVALIWNMYVRNPSKVLSGKLVEEAENALAKQYVEANTFKTFKAALGQAKTDVAALLKQTPLEIKQADFLAKLKEAFPEVNFDNLPAKSGKFKKEAVDRIQSYYKSQSMEKSAAKAKAKQGVNAVENDLLNSRMQEFANAFEKKFGQALTVPENANMFAKTIMSHIGAKGVKAPHSVVMKEIAEDIEKSAAEAGITKATAKELADEAKGFAKTLEDMFDFKLPKEKLEVLHKRLKDKVLKNLELLQKRYEELTAKIEQIDKRLETATEFDRDHLRTQKIKLEADLDRTVLQSQRTSALLERADEALVGTLWYALDAVYSSNAARGWQIPWLSEFNKKFKNKFDDLSTAFKNARENYAKTITEAYDQARTDYNKKLVSDYNIANGTSFELGQKLPEDLKIYEPGQRIPKEVADQMLSSSPESQKLFAQAQDWYKLQLSSALDMAGFLSTTGVVRGIESVLQAPFWLASKSWKYLKYPVVASYLGYVPGAVSGAAGLASDIFCAKTAYTIMKNSPVARQLAIIPFSEMVIQSYVPVGVQQQMKTLMSTPSRMPMPTNTAISDATNTNTQYKLSQQPQKSIDEQAKARKDSSDKADLAKHLKDSSDAAQLKLQEQAKQQQEQEKQKAQQKQQIQKPVQSQQVQKQNAPVTQQEKKIEKKPPEIKKKGEVTTKQLESYLGEAKSNKEAKELLILVGALSPTQQLAINNELKKIVSSETLPTEKDKAQMVETVLSSLMPPSKIKRYMGAMQGSEKAEEQKKACADILEKLKPYEPSN